ncbi:MAG: hypothetical protein AAGD13_01065 [Pseudomonadota bacterium]
MVGLADIGLVLLGAILGIGSSGIFWWIQTHYWVPKIEFSEEVSRSNVQFIKSKVRYQIAIKNIGRRDAYNVKFRVRLRVKDILKSGGRRWDYIDIAIINKDFFYFSKDSMLLITPLPHKTERFGGSMFPKEIRESYQNGTLTFDELFSVYDEIAIYVELIATDRFSGGAKFFRSKDYSKPDVRQGIFKGKDHKVIHKQSSPANS